MTETVSASRTSLHGAYVMLFLSCALGGGNFVAAKYLSQELSPLTGAAVRFALASAILMPWMLLREGRPDRTTIRHLPWLGLLGLTGVFGFNALLFIALVYTTATNASLISASMPIFVAILSVLLLRERLRAIQVAGILLSFSGVVYLVGQGSPENIMQLRFNVGDLLVVGAVICFALFNIAGKKISGTFSPTVTMDWAFSFGTVLLALFALLDPSWHSLERLTPSGVIAILYMAVLGTVGNYLLWYSAMTRLTATVASIASNVAPLSAFFWAALLLGEHITIYVVISACVVLTGVILTARGAKRDYSVS